MSAASKETYACGKRGLLMGKRGLLPRGKMPKKKKKLVAPTTLRYARVSKETSLSVYMPKEAYLCGKRGLFIWQKRPTNTGIPEARMSSSKVVVK